MLLTTKIKINHPLISSYLLFLYLIFFYSIQLSAQNTYELMDNVSVIENGTTLRFPFVGGLEKPRFSAADLNNDGIKDLVIFDKYDKQVLTFLNDGAANTIDYRYDCAYEMNFPAAMEDWAYLVDFNCDGVADLFTLVNSNIDVYTGNYNADNELEFQLFKTVLKDDAGTVIVNSYEDIPGVSDIDNDGDLDLLVNNVTTGRWIYYYQNQSQEQGYGCDSLIFNLNTYCWGEVMTEIATSTYQIDECPSVQPIPSNNIHQKQLHFARNFLAIDLDGDSDKDLLTGNGSLTNLHALINDGTPSFADVNTLDYNYLGASTTLPNLNYQAAAFYVDVNNDNQRDLLLSKTEQGKIDNANVSWLYENTNTDAVPNFNFVQDNWLIEDMVDRGTESTPEFYDYNNDGLIDLLITNYGYTTTSNTHISEIILYENIGTPTAPAFELINTDFGNFSTYQLSNLHPSFGDLDADGDMDIVMGEKDGNLYYFENNGSAFVLDVLALSIDVGQYSTPELLDFDGDGDLDLIVGSRNGEIYYYKNYGTPTSFNFQQFTTNLGSLDVNANIHSVPIFIEFGSNRERHIFVSYENGLILAFNGINPNVPSIPFFPVNTNFLSHAARGERLTIAAADIDNDGYDEFAVGNYRGGIALYEDPCPAPYFPTLANIGTSSVDIGWQGSAVANYEIQYRPIGTTTWSSISTNNANSFTLSGLLNCTTYEAQIRTVCNPLNSNYTSTISFTTNSPSAAWNNSTTIVACETAFDLNPLITGDIGGSWSGGSYISVNGFFDATVAGVGTHSVSYSVGNPVCDIVTQNITVTAAPTATWNGANITLKSCDNAIDLVPLIVGTSGGSWSGGSYINTSGIFDPSGLTVGSYTVTYSVGTGSCNVTESHNINIIADPDPAWGGTSLQACNNPINLNTLVTGDTGGSWSGGSYINTNGTFDPTGLATGNYSVTYSVGTGSCAISQMQNINILADPNPSWTGTTLQECDNAIDLNTLVTGDAGGSWSGGGYVNSAGIFTPTTLTAGNYNVTYSVGAGSCAFSQTQTVTVTASPTATWTAGSLSQCGGIVDLNTTVSGTTGGSWSGGSYISATGQFDPSSLSAGNYTVTYTVGTGSCATVSTQNIMVTAAPSATWTTTSIGECEDPFNLNTLVTGTVGGTWSGGLYISATGMFDPDGLNPGNYTVEYSVGSGSCADILTQTVTVAAATSNATWIPTSLQECEVALDLNTLVTGANGGSWSGGSYVSSSGMFSPSGLTPGNYSVSYSVGLGTCSFTETHDITILDSPTATWAGTSLQECDGSIDLNALVSGTTGGSWSGGSYVNSAGIFSPTGLVAGNYNVTYSVGSGSCGFSESHDIVLVASPSATWSGTSLQECDGSIDLNTLVSGTSGGSWSGGSYINSAGIFTPTTLATGNYNVTYSVGTGSCAISQMQNIVVTDSPLALWSPPASVQECDGAVDLNSFVVGTIGGSWSGGSYVSSMGIFDASGLSAGSYSVTYSIGSGSCQDQNTANIVVTDCSVTVRLKVYLEGAYNTFGGSAAMRTTLNIGGLLPLQQPYNIAPWNYTGTESVTTMPNNVVDWILVEVRDPNNSYTIIEQKAALLLENGNVQDITGGLGVIFYTITSGQNYYISVKHRNHLGVMSAVPLNLSNGLLYDFTIAKTQAYGSEQMKSIGSSAVLYAGDVNSDGIISVADYNMYQENSAIIGQYIDEDPSLDGNTTIFDFNLYRSNGSVLGVHQIRY